MTASRRQLMRDALERTALRLAERAVSARVLAEDPGLTTAAACCAALALTLIAEVCCEVVGPSVSPPSVTDREGEPFPTEIH